MSQRLRNPDLMSPFALAFPARKTRQAGCWWLVLLAFALGARGAGPYGTDHGWAVDHASGAIYLTSTLASQMSQGETGWIRIEMYLISGHTNWDATVLGLYDSAVNNARNAGIQVLLLIDGGSWPGHQSDWEANNSENNAGANRFYRLSLQFDTCSADRRPERCSRPAQREGHLNSGEPVICPGRPLAPVKLTANNGDGPSRGSSACEDPNLNKPRGESQRFLATGPDSSMAGERSSREAPGNRQVAARQWRCLAAGCRCQY